MWAGVSALALPAGPLLGGLLVASAGWRWVFWINLPVVVAALLGVLAWVPARRSRPAPGGPGHGARRICAEHRGASVPGLDSVDPGFDVAGTLLAAVTLAAAVCAVIVAGDGGPIVLVAVAAGGAVAAGLALVVVERRVAQPVLPLELFTRPAFSGANTVAFAMNLTVNGTLFVLTRFLQSVLGYGPLAAGAMLLPMFVPLAALAPLAGQFTARYGPRRPVLAGAVLLGLGELGLLILGADSGYLALLPSLLGVGIGAALLAAPVVAAAVGAVPAERSGLASGVNNAARQAGTALGVAVFGALAGAPEQAERFVAGLHGLGVAAAVLWLLGLAGIWATIPAARRPGTAA